MFKKIALAVALVAASSFATWDYYKIPEAGKGTVKGQFKYDTDDPWSGWGINVSGRYVVIPNLELSLQSFGFASQDDPDGSGLTDFTFGARYAVLPEMVNIFLDLNIPFGDEGEGGYIGSDEWAIYFGGQFFMEIIPQLLLGVEAGLDWGFEHNDFERGLVFNTGAEIGYTIKEIGLTPFAGIEFKYKLTDDEWNGAGAWEDNAGDNQFNLWIGVAYAINEAMAVDGKIKMRSGDIDGDATHFDVNFSYNF